MQKQSGQPALKPLLKPKYWPSWLLVGFLWLWTRLPFAWGMALGRSTKPMVRRLLKKRVPIIKQNLSACFPEKSVQERNLLLEQNLTALCSMPFETMYAWWRRPGFLKKLGQVHGFEHILKLQAEGRGIVLLSPHTTCMEIGSGLLTLKMPFSAVYRQHKNPVTEYIVRRGRETHAVSMINKRDIKTALRHLRRGGALWYTADMDMRGEQSIFAPFFGIQAATMTAPIRLLKAGKAVMVPMLPVREAGNRYRLEIFPPLPELTGDDIADLSRINAAIETMVRKAPEQYWWIHRRFKTRPPGEPPFYSD